MDSVALILRLVLSGVLVIAGCAKLSDVAGSRQAIREWGFPAVLAKPLGLTLPLLELLIALLLIPASTAFWGALAAFGLLAVFMVGIAANLLRGRTPDCHCFGQLYSKPVSWSTFARNSVLAACAAVVAWHANVASPISIWSGSTNALIYVALIGLAFTLSMCLLFGWALLHMLKQNGRLLLRVEALEQQLGVEVDPAQPVAVEGLPVGMRAPQWSLPDVHGASHTLQSFLDSGKRTLLIFSDPGCTPCNSLLPDIARWQREHRDTLLIASISRGAVELNRAKSTEHDVAFVLLQQDHEVGEAYKVERTPSAMLINVNGTIASPIAAGPDAIRRLLAEAVGQPNERGRPIAPRLHIPLQTGAPRPPQGIPVGSLAPTVALPDLDGNMVELSAFHGQRTVVLFWNPGCGFCQRMLDDLRAWAAKPPRNAPRLVFISSGNPGQLSSMDLPATVLLDSSFTMGRAFGASGTPGAVLLDADGSIASPVAIGAPAIMPLLGIKPAVTHIHN